MAVQLVSKAAYARHRGCDEKAVRKAIAEGRISAIDGKIDPAVADIQWAQNTRARADSKTSTLAAPASGQQLAAIEYSAAEMENSSSQELRANSGAASGGGVNSTEPTYHDYRTRRERADAERAERENARDAGLLIERESTERAIFDAFRALRDAAMAAPQRAAAKVIGLSDAREIERVFHEELRRAFEGWEARMLARLPAKEGSA